MNQPLSVACLQMNSSDSVVANLAFIESSLESGLASGKRVDIVLLPENFAQMPAHRHQQYSEADGDGKVQTKLAELAQKFDTCLIGGSLAVDDSPSGASGKEQKPFARCLAYSKSGERVAQYDKLHLFDIDVSTSDQLSSHSRYRESDSYAHGELGESAITTFTAPESGAKVGLTICYDLRFAELYRVLSDQGVHIITVPSAFTEQTGKAHWYTLLRARAIENQVYIMAAAQVGKHASGRRTYGHSLIIDPWGEVLAEKTAGVGLLIADIDLSYIDRLKANMPIKEHRRLL